MKSVYKYIITEIFIPSDTNRQNDSVHIRLIFGQITYLSTMFVECSKSMSNNCPVDTRFKLKVKIVSKCGGTGFVYSHYSLPFTFVE